ncbi:Alanine/arginine aminopeptidase [Erysiphe neolycopersici]|uniref:Aminopeptidase n=1 Tax=Erysiphe neolycopersici TaxID=212602 RepID=A0A420HTI5_9PEZI|nr:Alanine/arginine aminopeptidase [Erysiphe neolycopersici]
MVITNTDRDILPNHVKPINYNLSLYDLELQGNFKYQGTVRILSTFVKSFKEITLNAHEIQLHSAEIHLELSETQQTFESVDISYDVSRQRVTIHFPVEIPKTERGTIVIRFQGKINNNMAGFYRSKYKPLVAPALSVPSDGDFHLMFSTQFESCDARRAFPCFDEPNLKASFEFEIEVPDDQIALSNMPEKSSKVEKKGFKAVSFERTPIMSTYLLAWAVGDFEFIEVFTERRYRNKPLPIRIYTTKGLKSQGQFTLELVPQIVDYYSDIFGIEYPLPKCDLLVVHEFSHGAMENWGLITYRTTALLFDEQVSDTRYKIRIATTVAHELAHQWFGNLVTMDWWNELWLNEGFATWVASFTIDHIHPEWHAWPRFVSEGMQTAFSLDSLRSSHPIEVPVKDALDVDQIFDSISYLKGSSVIRMLASYLGQDTFLRGIGAYLKAHAYRNATTNDLWSSLSDVSRQDITSLMDPWIRKIGFPILTPVEEDSSITVKQCRYLSTGDIKPHEDVTTWWVPLRLESNLETKKNNFITLTKKEDTFKDLDTSFYKLNKDYSGFYRTNYPPSRLVTYSKQIDRLNLTEKIGLIADAGALAISGETSTVGLLAFIEGFQSEANYFVWSQILSSLVTVKTAFSGDQLVSNGLKRFIIRLISPAVEKIGWESSSDDDILIFQLRALLVLTAGLNGHKSVITEAKRRFELYITNKDKTVINQNLRSTIFGIAIHEGENSEYQALKNEWFKTTSIDGKEIALRALGRIQVPQVHTDYLDFLFKEVAIQDIHTGAMALSANPKARLTLWRYIQTHFNQIRSRLGKNMIVLDRFLRVSLTKFNEREIEREIAAFFANKDNRGYDRTLRIISDTILGRAAYKERDRVELLGWLKSHGYIFQNDDGERSG